MRNLVAGLAVYGLLLAPGVLTAQTFRRHAVRSTDLRHHGERKTLAEELVFQRALRRARQRDARIQYRKWSGQSILRPGMRTRYRTAKSRPRWYRPF